MQTNNTIAYFKSIYSHLSPEQLREEHAKALSTIDGYEQLEIRSDLLASLAAETGKDDLAEKHLLEAKAYRMSVDRAITQATIITYYLHH